jgi:uncharacterized protein (DUF488 family)
MSVVYTIGYEATDIDRFVETLLKAKVKVVADVRALALSRKKGFSKKALSERLAKVGIEYLHFIKLGDPKPGRDAARAGKFKQFESIYRRHIAGEDQMAELASLQTVVWSEATCLLCFERDPNMCHRKIVAEQLSKSGLRVFDLFGDNPKQYDIHAARIPRHYPRQGSAAA